MTSPIVLLTDFGFKDHYVGSLKGVILSINPNVTIIDLSHGVEAQNIVQAACLLETSYHHFPKGTLFVSVVDPGVGTKRKILCVQTDRYYFIAPDNGLLAPTLKHEKRIQIRSVTNSKFFWQKDISSTFHGRDIMAPTAAHISKAEQAATAFTQVGPKLKKIQSLAMPRIKKLRTGLQGEIVYFDHFGNAATNIHRDDSAGTFWRMAEVQVKDLPCGRLVSTYVKAEHGLIALFDSSNRLEIAVPKGNAKEECSLTIGDTVTVRIAYGKK